MVKDVQCKLLLAAAKSLAKCVCNYTLTPEEEIFHVAKSGHEHRCSCVIRSQTIIMHHSANRIGAAFTSTNPDVESISASF